jgi:hypothetical protein
MLVYPRVGCGSTMCTCFLFALLLVYVSQAGLEIVSGSAGALLVSQCKMVWRSFVWAGNLGVSEFCFFLVVFPAKGGSSVSARILLYRVHVICFLPLVPILDLSTLAFYAFRFYICVLCVCSSTA